MPVVLIWTSLHPLADNGSQLRNTWILNSHSCFSNSMMYLCKFCQSHNSSPGHLSFFEFIQMTAIPSYASFSFTIPSPSFWSTLILLFPPRFSLKSIYLIRLLIIFPCLLAIILFVCKQSWEAIWVIFSTVDVQYKEKPLSTFAHFQPTWHSSYLVGSFVVQLDGFKSLWFS